MPITRLSITSGSQLCGWKNKGFFFENPSLCKGSPTCFISGCSVATRTSMLCSQHFLGGQRSKGSSQPNEQSLACRGDKEKTKGQGMWLSGTALLALGRPKVEFPALLRGGMLAGSSEWLLLRSVSRKSPHPSILNTEKFQFPPCTSTLKRLRAPLQALGHPSRVPLKSSSSFFPQLPPKYN